MNSDHIQSRNLTLGYLISQAASVLRPGLHPCFRHLDDLWKIAEDLKQLAKEKNELKNLSLEKSKQINGNHTFIRIGHVGRASLKGKDKQIV